MKKILTILCSLVLWSCAWQTQASSELRVLFLGDDGHHRPGERFKQLQPVLSAKQIELTYTESLQDLNPAKLAGYDALAIYANHTRISSGQEKALLQFVEEGGGLVALHCASYCFLNSDKYIELVGGQFKSHGTGVFRETLTNPAHPILKGLEPIESWDETYVHTRHNPNRTVLAERRDQNGAEPYTWVREHGKGRVFYTAWGHDQRTWSHPGFHALVERGIRWASANSPAQLKVSSGLKPFEYMEAPSPLPNYVPNARWGTQGDPIRTMQKPLDPEESARHLAVFPEFEKSLFAAEPEIVKPIWLAWDERGRLWIAETVDYPNELQPLGQGRDRLKICEDTNGDGKADKFTVFVDKLSVPTSFVFANGGVIVVHSGKTEFIRDTDGDDRADERRDLFVGWGTGDTHAGPSNLRYGVDNWIWGVVGYSGFRGTIGGKEIRFGQGIFRFKPDGSRLEFVRSSNNNTWGLGFTEEGIVIGSTANGNASMYMPIPNRYYEAVRGWSASRLESIADSQRFYPITEKVRQVDFHGRYTAGSGSAIYTARSFPERFWNRAQFVTEPTGHLIGLFYLIPQGADFVAHNARNFAASDDEWSSPIAAEVGPDGALWVLDWYNYIIQHNPTPQGFENGKGNAYETPLRDKKHGRIYRISYKSGQPSVAPRLASSDGKSLLQGLQSDNLLWRLHAQRMIVENGKVDLIPALCELVENTKVDRINLNPAAIHALWSLDGVGAFEKKDSRAVQAALKGLRHPSAGVRRNALLVLPRQPENVDAILQGDLLADPDAQVRLAALLALAEMPPSDQVGPAIVRMLQAPENSQDTWIPDAASAAAARHDVSFLKAILASFKPVGSGAEGASQNLIQNPSFETVSGERPVEWRTVVHGGRAEFQLADQGRTGTRSVKISSEGGADASWATRVQVKPRTEYRLTGWIKTAGVQKIGGAHGAMFNIHELQDPVRGATKALVGDNDWTQVQLSFNSGQLTEVTINCLFGAWGRATGTAWFDDVTLALAPGATLGGELGRVVRVVTSHYAQRAPTDSIIQTLKSLQGASSDVATAFLDGMVAGWPEGKAPEVGAAEKRELGQLMQQLPESVRDRLLALSLKWGKSGLFEEHVREITEGLRQQITRNDSKDGERVSAASRLVTLDDRETTVALLLKQISLLTPPDLYKGLLTALGESRNAMTGQQIIGAWQQLGPGARRQAISVLMRRPEWANALLDAVEKETIRKADLAAEHWTQLRQNPNRGIARRAERLSASAGISADREGIVKQLLPLARQSGDPAQGKEVFAAACMVCHVFNGQGGTVGPDLTGIASRDPGDILLDILDPNRSVEANYQLWTVTTRSGETYAGRLETETQTTVEILDTAGQKHVIQRGDITDMQSSGISIMPSGFEALSESDIKGLLAYLTSSDEAH